MSADFDSLINRGEYFTSHYFAEQLADDLRKGVFAAWSDVENDPVGNERRRFTPRDHLGQLHSRYHAKGVRGFFINRAKTDENPASFGLSTYGDEDWRDALSSWHRRVLRALGFESGKPTDPDPEDTGPTTLAVHQAGQDHEVEVAWHGDGIVVLECGWSDDVDATLDSTGPGRLLHPLRASSGENYETGPALASWLFRGELGGKGGEPPRFVLLLCGGVLVLTDGQSWSEGRFLAASLDAALQRNDTRKTGEIATIFALFGRDMLRPGTGGTAPRMDALLKGSTNNAVAVSPELRDGLQRSVEIIANEVLVRLDEAGVEPRRLERPGRRFADELTEETLRYLYRILFLLYAESRPELGILPSDDTTYEAGYSVARLRELVARDERLVEEEAKNSFHLYESLAVLFDKVNNGHRMIDDDPDDDGGRGLRFEALRSELFDPKAVRLIGRPEHPSGTGTLDLRLRNTALHEVLRLLTMKKGQSGNQGGFISYRNLGINQLGAVYEGLMSYTGIIAEEELCEVAKDGDPEAGSWLIPANRQRDYPEHTLVEYDEHDNHKGLRGPKRYRPGTFVYRLSGRARETSASYYTPESLTKVTVELALKERLNQERDSDGNVRTRAAELLRLKICEPALGSGAFLNEVINQVAEEYLRRRTEELGKSLPASEAVTEKQKVKAYIALHNVYGVDLNATGVELAEVSLWLNTMHPGMRAPWFGLHLRRGDSLIGARRAVFAADEVTTRAWTLAKNPLEPTPLPFRRDGARQPLPDGAVHQFLLPAPGWASVCGSKEAKALVDRHPAKIGLTQLDAWRKGILGKAPKRSTAHINKKTGEPKIDKKTKEPLTEYSQYTRLRDAARRFEYLWSLVVRRMELSERAISRRIDVWGAEGNEYDFLARPDTADRKEDVYRDLFYSVDTPYWRLKKVMDAWCALWFWPADQAGLLNGSASEYHSHEIDESAESLAALIGAPLVEPAAQQHHVDNFALFSVPGEQTDLLALEAEDSVEFPVERKVLTRKSVQQAKSQSKRKEPPPSTPATPLRNLDDWLDFLEAMLGKSDPDGTFADSFDSLDELKKHEESLPLTMQMAVVDPDHSIPEVDLERRFPWLHTVHEITEKKGFLHWELEFAMIFADHGGFDLQVGNPPWYRPRWDEDAVLAEHEPWFALEDKPDQDVKARRRTEVLDNPDAFAYTLGEQTGLAAQVAWLGSSQVYPLLSGTQPNLYRAFMSQIWDHACADGTAGMVHPDTHFSGEKEGALREAAYRRLRIHGDFFNPGHRFFPEPVGESSHFGVHVYGRPGPVDFAHLSWLVSTDTLRGSLADGAPHDRESLPSIRNSSGKGFDDRPHRDRVIPVNVDRLATWQRLLGETDVPVAQARLLFPVSVAENDAIEALADYPLRLGALAGPQFSPGYHESGAKNRNLIAYNRPDPATGKEFQPDRWHRVVLVGKQLGVATPTFKRHDANSNDPYGHNLVSLPDDFVSDTAYLRVAGRGLEYLCEQDRWINHRALDKLWNDERAVARARTEIAAAKGIPEENVEFDEIEKRLVEQSRRWYTMFPRSAWREMIAPDTERSLYVALVAPGTAHVHSVRSAALPNPRETVLMSGLWSGLPLDYYLRITGKGHLDAGQARRMPAPHPDHPLAPALLLRTLRLNCLTTAYAKLWAELYDPAWRDTESWAVDWPGLPPLQDVTPEWQRNTPLRTERARRSALVEIDALVAVWLGMSAEALVAAYKGRFPVLLKYEAVTCFDADGWKIAGEARTRGQKQGPVKDTWPQLQEYLAAQHTGDDGVAPPEGFTPPFYKAKREDEMKAAHGVFQAQLDAAIERGEWDPSAPPSTPDTFASLEGEEVPEP
ncbi:hypothetical protein [Saccharopolyspora pogona]|uniref:hypothetical protein n=1 Tax=Saccharopolyspora pogona TaxID=333966 RepID=UPI0016861DA7|nr:hypothetical protein [Saccharopolyspora pogona]